MKNKQLTRTLLVAFSLFAFAVAPCNGQSSAAPAPGAAIAIGKTIKYPASLLLYKYDRQNHCDQSKGPLIVYNNKISPCFSFVRALSKQESQRIINIVNSVSTYGGEDVACFDTDYALLVMNGKTIVGHISISFSCNKLISAPVIKAREHYTKGELRKVGFSPSGRSQLLKLLKLSN